MRAYPEQTEELIAAARKAAREFGLMLCSSGNISWRVDDDAVLISASRSWLSELTAEQVVQMRLSDGEVVNGPRPSVESLFTWGFCGSGRT